MGKIRKSILRRREPEKAPRLPKEEEWDVNKEGFYRDEIDDWQEMKGRLMLDTLEPASFSEDDSEEEVLGLNLSESEEEKEAKDEGEEMEDSEDDEIEEDGEPEGPSDKAWGHRKKAFYSTDYVDDEDVYSSDVSAAEEEEKEALSLQRRMTEGLSKEDFGLDYLSTVAAVGEAEGEEPQEAPEVSMMSEQERLVYMQEKWPEFLELYQDLKEKAEYISEIIGPLKKLSVAGVLSQDGVQVTNSLSSLHHLFCLNIAFYLVLRASSMPVENHPVIARIVQLREMLGAIRSIVNEDDIAHQIENIDTTIKTAKESSSCEVNDDTDKRKRLKRKSLEETTQKKAKKKKQDVESTTVDDEDPLEYYNRIKQQTEQRKQKKVTFKERKEEGEMQNGDEDDEGTGKRPITYQISKNKGLTPKRKKEQRNPRVKYHNKFVKALSKHRHVVRPVEREMSRYGGELTGIKSRLSRSVKIK